MVDLESHRIIDLIPSRDVADVREWLRKYPNIEYVSRDGAQIYALAVKIVHPNAIQISDRFHLIKGLSEAVNKYIIRTFPARVEIPAIAEQSEEMKQLLNISNRAQRIRFTHEKKSMGMTVNEIALMLRTSPRTVEKYLNTNPETVKDRQTAKEMHRHYKTIQNYLDPNYSLENGHHKARIPGKLEPYETEVKELRSQGVTYIKIHKIISEKGYQGSVASLRMFMQME